MRLRNRGVDKIGDYRASRSKQHRRSGIGLMSPVPHAAARRRRAYVAGSIVALATMFMTMAAPATGQAPKTPTQTRNGSHSATTGEVARAEDGGVTTPRGRQELRGRRVQEAPRPRIPIGEDALQKLKSQTGR